MNFFGLFIKYKYCELIESVDKLLENSFPTELDYFVLLPSPLKAPPSWKFTVTVCALLMHDVFAVCHK